MAALLVALFALPALADQRDFTVVNNSSLVLTHVYVTSSDTTAWGDDIMGRDVLNPSETVDVPSAASMARRACTTSRSWVRAARRATCTKLTCALSRPSRSRTPAKLAPLSQHWNAPAEGFGGSVFLSCSGREQLLKAVSERNGPTTARRKASGRHSSRATRCKLSATRRRRSRVRRRPSESRAAAAPGRPATRPRRACLPCAAAADP